MEYRIEKDTMGEVKVPADKLWGAQTERSRNNFKIGTPASMPLEIVYGFAYLKKAAAFTNCELGVLAIEKRDLIAQVCDEILEGKHDDQFPLVIWQTGSGTQSNMNVNEVIANRAQQLAGKVIGEGEAVIKANDDVNKSQSSNDTFPTGMHIAAYKKVVETTIPGVIQLRNTLHKKALAYKDVVKIGRTHLMDAMPIDMSQELNAWKSQLESSQESLLAVTDKLLFLPQGGTAVGTGINAHPRFSKEFAKEVSNLGKIKAKPSNDFFHSLSAQDTSLQTSGELRNLATILIKISNDLRWMNSGPLTGLGEIELKALQPGSSIMPGKVNPVIPESVLMVCADVIGNDTTVAIAAQSGNFQLNVMLPVIAYNVLKSINILSGALTILSDKAIKTFKVNNKKIADNLKRNPILVTALNPVIGYAKAAEIAKKAYREGRPILDVALEETNLSRRKLEKILDPANLTKGGIKK